MPTYHPGDIEKIAAVFVESTGCTVEALGKGNINDTYLVSAGTWRFVLQRINERVFPEPEKVAGNTAAICDYLQGKQRSETSWRIPRVILTLEGAKWYVDDFGSVWRAQSFIEDTTVIDRVENPAQAREAGSCLGWFHALAAGLDPEQLEIVLPGFHDLPAYLKVYDRIAPGPGAAEETRQHRFCRTIIEKMRARAGFFADARRRGLLGKAIVHGDPKITNVLFGAGSGRAVALIDLDTVGPGLTLQDIGDGMRSCCCTVAEGEDQGEARFDIGLFEAYLDGYLRWRPLDDFERDHLFDALLLITFELGLRFFSDHLQGNIYFKVAEPGENLRRASEQFTLAASIAAAESPIRRSIARLTEYQGNRKRKST